MKKKKGGSNVV